MGHDRRDTPPVHPMSVPAVGVPCMDGVPSLPAHRIQIQRLTPFLPPAYNPYGPALPAGHCYVAAVRFLVFLDLRDVAFTLVWPLEVDS